MSEPRARAQGPRRPGALQFHESDLSELLYAFGDSAQPLPTTISTLDAILTDFIIETCHQANLSASYSRRQKIKVDDFKWVLRNNEVLLGRVMESMWKRDVLKEERKAIDMTDGMTVGRGGEMDGIIAAADVAGAKKEMKKKGGKRGRKRRADETSTMG